MSYYKDKIIIITGASSGIGKAIAKALHKEGARLLLLGRNLDLLKSELPDNYSHMFYTIDLLQDASVYEFVQNVIKDYEKIDILIHSAGVIHLGTIAAMPVEDLDEQYKINTRAPFLLTQKLLPLVKKANGQIVFLNSTAGLQTREFLGSYSASKFALKAIADSLRLEVRTNNINVLSVFLGATATPMQEKIQNYTGKSFHADDFMSVSEIADKIVLVMRNGKEARITDITIKDQENFHFVF